MANLSSNLSGYGNIVAVSVTAEDGTFTDDVAITDDLTVGDDVTITGSLTVGDITCGGATFSGQTNMAGNFIISAGEYRTGFVTPAALTGNTDNYAPTGYGSTGTLLISATGAVNLTGFNAIQYLELTIINTGANTITLKHDVTSTATNRFYLPGAVDYALLQYQSATIYYVPALSRWLIKN